MVFGGAWHTDSAFLSRPPAISMLYCVDAPPYGGDTWFANTVLAHQFLSSTMQAMIAPLKVHMSARNVLAGIQNKTSREDSMNAVADTLDHEQMMIRGSFHPLVRRHPETGEQALYVDQTYSVGIEGMHHNEASSMIDFLVQHATQPLISGTRGGHTVTLASLARAGVTLLGRARDVEGGALILDGDVAENVGRDRHHLRWFAHLDTRRGIGEDRRKLVRADDSPQGAERVRRFGRERLDHRHDG